MISSDPASAKSRASALLLMLGDRLIFTVGMGFGTRTAFAVLLIAVIEEVQLGAQERASVLGSAA